MSIGTRKVGYAGPQYGPFHCGNCKHFSKGECNEDEVKQDPQLKKAKNGNALVEADGCCNEFDPRKVNVARLATK